MKEHAIVSEWVSPKSRVLDLGCGDGSLLVHLKKQKEVTGYGLEISRDCILKCAAKGVSVIEQNFDEGLGNFATGSFDTVLLTDTLQVARQTDKLVAEMLRVGKQAVVSFNNFSHWQNRFYLGIRGQMPMSKHIPYAWYDTPNIHHCTVSDFDALCHQKGYKVLERKFEGVPFNAHLLANVCATKVMYLLTKK